MCNVTLQVSFATRESPHHLAEGKIASDENATLQWNYNHPLLRTSSDSMMEDEKLQLKFFGEVSVKLPQDRIQKLSDCFSVSFFPVNSLSLFLYIGKVIFDSC